MPCGRWHLAITAGASTVRPSYGPHQPVYLRSAWEVAAEIADYQDSGLEVVGGNRHCRFTLVRRADHPRSACRHGCPLSLPAGQSGSPDEQRASNWSAHSARARTLCHGASTAVGETRGGRTLRRVRLRLEIQAVAATSFTQAIAVGTSAVPAARQRRHRPG